MKRLGFITPSLAFRADDGSVWTNSGLGRLIEAVAARSDGFTLATSTAHAQSDQHDHRLQLAPRSIRFLPSMPTIARGLAKGRACRNVVRDVEQRSDAVIVQLPFSAPTALITPSSPRIYHVCADLPGVVGASRYYRGARRVAALATAHAIDQLQRTLMWTDASRVVTNGVALAKRYGSPPGRSVVSSSLHAGDIGAFQRLRAANDAFTVLFVGYLRPEKGIDVLIGAFRKLLRVDARARLIVVGGLDAQDTGAAAEARRSLDEWVREGRAELAGAIPFGPRLFQRYADADVLVLPSLSEGTPRVLVEARAFGCPVVASNVGGIPTSVDSERDGLLVPPSDVDALFHAIDRIRCDAPLRAALVKAGFARAAATTVEAQAAALVEEAEQLLESQQ